MATLQDLAITLAPADAAARRATFADLQDSLPSTIQTEAGGPYLVTNPQRVGQLARRRHADHAADGPVPLRAVGIQAPLRRHPRRHRLHRRARTPTGSPTGSTRTSACRSPCRTTAARAPTPGTAPTGCPPSSGGRRRPSSHPAAAGWTRSSVRSRPARRGRSASQSTNPRARDQVDQDREPTIEVSKDGPYRITGGSPAGRRGRPGGPNAGASLEHYSLCRCGHSRNKPFCSGMHWYVDFQDPCPSGATSRPCSSGPAASPRCGG